jgi:hypothetical protein
MLIIIHATLAIHFLLLLAGHYGDSDLPQLPRLVDIKPNRLAPSGAGW